MGSPRHAEGSNVSQLTEARVAESGLEPRQPGVLNRQAVPPMSDEVITGQMRLGHQCFVNCRMPCIVKPSSQHAALEHLV